MLTSKQRTVARAIATASAAATMLLAFGCGAMDDSDDAQAPPPPARSVPATPESSSSAAPTTSDPPSPAEETPAAGAAPEECVAADLSLSLSNGDAAAGTLHKNLTFTNSGSKPCTMVGYPGVSFVTGDSGKQVGEAAFREGGKGAPVTLPVGGTATAPLGFTQVDNFDQQQCKKTSVRGLRIYPPHDTASMFLPAPGFGCAGDISQFGHQLTVETVR